MGGQQTGQHGKIANYTFKNLREAISNCVAHQNYEMKEKIWVYESDPLQLI
jgi:predicted HTH transcriptional regulator